MRSIYLFPYEFNEERKKKINERKTKFSPLSDNLLRVVALVYIHFIIPKHDTLNRCMRTLR